MKERIKLIIVFVLGIMISVVLSVYAATIITAGEVSYTSNSNTTVQTGLDNLYTRANSTANDVTKLKTFEQLWSGISEHNTSYTLSKSIANYKFLLVIYQTNTQYYTDYIPVTIINTSGTYSFSKTTLEHSSNGQISQNAWSYQATVDLCFTSNTTFKIIKTYNNGNLTLRVVKIYGVITA